MNYAFILFDVSKLLWSYDSSSEIEISGMDRVKTLHVKAKILNL